MKLDRATVMQWMPNDLDEIAKETKAIRRRRVVQNAEQLLWMALMYSGVLGSLRNTAAMGAMTGDFDINDTSVRYRLRQAVPFLTAVLNWLLLGSVRSFRSAGIRRRICLHDATVVSIPGSKGTDFRLHSEYVPGQGLAHVEVTDSKGGESLKRGEYQPGDLVIADQGLAHASGIHHVHAQGAFSLVRVYLRNIHLEHLDGTRLIVEKALDLADLGVRSLPVQVPLKPEQSPVKARLVMAKLPPEKAARARQSIEKRARKKGNAATELALRLAGYVVILTTMDDAELPDEDVLKTYRLRWQIELFFKRCKSLMRMDKLAASGQLARSWLLGKLIIAALVDRSIFKLRSEFEGNQKLVVDNLWRLTELCFLDLNRAILEVDRDCPILSPHVREKLTEPPRKRVNASPHLNALYRKFNPAQRQKTSR